LWFLAFVALLAAGCGSLPGGKGTATVWVTRDRGAHVLLVRHVPAGETAMQALERVAKVKTAYDGRYVESVDGVSGSLSAQRDWFYFVNGIESDRGAVDYTLHAGDIEWWDYRSWRHAMSAPVVVGAFPEPFLHGFAGKARASVVLGSGPGARALAQVVHGKVVSRAPADANVLRLVDGTVRFTAHERSGGGVEFVYSGDAMRLAHHPGIYRYRYEVK
jgi:Domain of unknown function (DUF4430)